MRDKVNTKKYRNGEQLWGAASVLRLRWSAWERRPLLPRLIQTCTQLWVPEWQALNQVPCPSMLLKICPPERASNLFSRMPGKTIYRMMSCWNHSAMKTAKVGAGISCRPLGAADYQAQQEPAEQAHPTQGGEAPFSYYVSPVSSMDKA